MKTAWTIDVDHVTVPGEKSRVGCYGHLASEYPFRWRVKDADGFVYKQEWWTTWLIERPFRDPAGLLDYVRRKRRSKRPRQRHAECDGDRSCGRACGQLQLRSGGGRGA